MMLSVVVVTNRVGGLDVLRAGLRAQTFKDFELILVDELYEWRRFQVAELFDGIRVMHLKPRNASKRWGNYMRSLNTALHAASGEHLVFWSDYTCPDPKTLAEHAAFHASEPEAVLLGGIRYLETPQLHPEFPRRYGWEAIGHKVGDSGETYAPWLDDERRHALYEEFRATYEYDLENGTLDPFMLSTFKEPFEDMTDLRGLRELGFDSRDSLAMNLKNDSIPRSALEQMGGFDERADDCHGHQDSITATQLKKKLVPFHYSYFNPVHLLDPHGIAIIRRMERPDMSNLELYEKCRC